MILVSGLSFTALLGTFLLILSGGTARVEELVLDRTRALSMINQELAHEIVNRQRVEKDLFQASENLERRVQERTAELKASESRYLDLYDNAPDMFVTFDVATQSVIECNQTFLAVTGYTKTEVSERTIYDLYHPDCLDEARRAFGLFLATGQMKDLELLLLCANGEVVEASMNVSAVRDESGRLLFLSCRVARYYGQETCRIANQIARDRVGACFATEHDGGDGGRSGTRNQSAFGRNRGLRRRGGDAYSAWCGRTRSLGGCGRPDRRGCALSGCGDPPLAAICAETRTRPNRS